MRVFLLLLICQCYLPSLQAIEGEKLKDVAYSSLSSLTVPIPDDVVKYGTHPLQFIERWEPKDSAADIFFIHGGCWLSAYDIKHSQPLSHHLRNKGFRVWSIEYRRAGDEGGGWPNTLHDINAAIDMVLGTFPEVQSPILVGHSAGGHLALMAAQSNLTKLGGVLGLAAITDIEEYSKGENSCQKATESFIGGPMETNVGLYKAANPIYHLPHPRTQLLYGEKDVIVPNTQAFKFDNVIPIAVPDAGHFDFIHPQSEAWDVVLKAINHLTPSQSK